MDEAKKAVLETILFSKRKPKSYIHPSFGEYSRMYTFTTENIGEYIKPLNVKNCDILSIGASGDHLINFKLFGANNVDCYDCNKNTYYFINLKLAALQALDYQEFLDYFITCESSTPRFNGFYFSNDVVGKNEKYLDFNIYKKIRTFLNDDVKLYWDLLYKECNNSGDKLSNMGIFYGSTLEEAIYVNPYLKDSNAYNKAKKKCSNITFKFYPYDIFELNNIPNNYDLILLSNIFDYVADSERGIVSDFQFVKYVENELSKILNENGRIAVSYQYRYRKLKYNVVNPNFFEKLSSKNYKLQQIDMFKEYKKIIINSYTKHDRVEGNKDCLYIYNKNQKIIR